MRQSDLRPARGPNPPALAAQGDFFICDMPWAVPKDDMASMEHPLFTLATRPDRRILRYEHGPALIEVTPSVKGLATIHDKDVLIYCVSQLMAAVNEGRPTSPELHLRAHDLLLATNRETSGDGYRRLREAFERLSGTRIVTNIATGGVESTRGFGLIDAWEILRKTRGGRMIHVTVTLSDWMYRSVMSKSVLTLHRDYFRLRKPLERRVYEIARKHCGRQAEWRIGLETLAKKTGSTSPRRVFRKMIRDMAEEDGLPDYRLALTDADLVLVRARGRLAAETAEGAPRLGPEAHARAREAAPGYDPYWLEAEWTRLWQASGRPELRSPEAAFLAFCRSRAARAGGLE
ncbi:MAG: replication initiator protein A [Amaricoccus sp.]|uniref:replication initiator protein A n=1 Tax=Amaricoccus sp. TaxID=1872485 RepID=UPI003314D94E